MVNEINTERQVKVWKKPSYRALTLRIALRGPPAEFIEQEANMQREWVKDDEGILGKLQDRYIKNTAVELHIIAFESASKKEGEPLAEYMTGLQKLIGDAYPEYPEWVRKLRTVWQFLNGARDKDVTEELITKGWMKDGKDSKEYDEILKLAEGVINKKKVTKATGKIGFENHVNAVVGKSRNTTSGYVRNKRTNTNAGHSNPIGANWNCFCCKTDEHLGGWRNCPQLGRPYPGWKQGTGLRFFSSSPLVDSKFEEWGCKQTKRRGFRQEETLSEDDGRNKSPAKRSDKREDVEKIRSSSGTRPWSGTCARIKVIDNPKGTKDRCKKLREKKMAWHQILSRSPQVMVHLGIEDCSALLDAGAY